MTDARRRRHAFLITKMVDGGVLSAAEVRELEKYEREYPPEHGKSITGELIKYIERLQRSGINVDI